MDKFLSLPEVPIDINTKLFSRKKLGSGTFGDIYLGLNTQTNTTCAIKCEEIKNQYNNSLLKYEADILQYLQKGIGIPDFYAYISKEKYNFMLFELLGPSLEDLFDLCQQKFSLKTILQLGDQIISRIEFLHSRYLIHRDVKPNNFLIGLFQKKNIIYICDFGLAKFYKDPHNGKHIPYKDGKSQIGTVRYCSINSHLGIEQSRRDDLESLFYTLIYFCNGFLPWQGIKAKNKNEKNQLILEKKISTSINEICKNLPNEFATLFNYIKNLKFEDKPNYLYLKELLGKIFNRNNYIYDLNFDFSYLFENYYKQLEDLNINNQNEKNKVINETNDKIINNNEKQNYENNPINKKMFCCLYEKGLRKNYIFNT